MSEGKLKIYTSTQHSIPRGNFAVSHYVAVDPQGKQAHVSVLHPKTVYDYTSGFQQEHGQGVLFTGEHIPATINMLDSSFGSSHLVATLLAHAHRVHRGDITHPDPMNMNEYSAAVTRRALSKNWIKSNPSHSWVWQDFDGFFGRQRDGGEREYLEPEDGTLITDPEFRKQNNFTEVPTSEVEASRQHFRNMADPSRFRPQVPSTPVDQPTLPGM